METTKIFNCKYCTYTSNRKFNLNSHEINKHSKEILNETSKNNILNKVHENIQEVHENIHKVHDNIEVQNPIKPKYFCSKCSKEYLTLKHLNNHEIKCIGISILTCPKCMKTFSSKQDNDKRKGYSFCTLFS